MEYESLDAAGEGRRARTMAVDDDALIEVLAAKGLGVAEVVEEGHFCGDEVEVGWVCVWFSVEEDGLEVVR